MKRDNVLKIYFEYAHKMMANIQNSARFIMCVFLTLHCITGVYYFIYYLSNFSTNLYLQYAACLLNYSLNTVPYLMGNLFLKQIKYFLCHEVFD